MVELNFSDPSNKWAVLREIKDKLIMQPGFIMDDVDEHKPWGAYYRFVGSQKQKFLDEYYSDVDIDVPGEVNPKYLVFEPGKKLSFQYHDRRAETWKVIYGEVEAYNGPEDEVGEYKTYKTGDVFTYDVKMRHKGGATANGWAIVAEIWQHVDADNPSDEEDIVRLADDYGRA